MLTRVCLILLLPLCANAGVGDPDPDFGDNGLVRVPFDQAGAFVDVANSLALLPDGRVILAGAAQRPAQPSGKQDGHSFARVLADGSALDATFGTAGVRQVSFGSSGGSDRAVAVTVLPNGRLLAMGEVETVDGKDFSLVRLLENGTLDPGFDLDGRHQIDFGGTEAPVGLALQPDGKILAFGAQLDAAATGACALLARFEPDGSLDPTFAGDGWTCLSPVNGTPSIALGRDVVVQADGRIVLALAVNTSTTAAANIDMAFVRLLPDGSPDPDFGSDGLQVVVFDQGADNTDAPVAMALQPDGRIVAVGEAAGALGTDISIVQLLPDGTPDPGFGSGGRVLIGIDLGGSYRDGATALALPDDGRILVVGCATHNVGGNTTGVVLMLHGDGSFDTGFGDSGRVLYRPMPFDEKQDFARFNDVLLRGDDIYIAGMVSGSPGSSHMALVKLHGETVFRDGLEAL